MIAFNFFLYFNFDIKYVKKLLGDRSDGEGVVELANGRKNEQILTKQLFFNASCRCWRQIYFPKSIF